MSDSSNAVANTSGQTGTSTTAVDSTGQTIDFLLTAKRDAHSATRFFRKVFAAAGTPMARVLNVDKNPAIRQPFGR